MLIKDLFQNNIERTITSVVKVDDFRASEIVQELHEYVVTEQLEKSILSFLELFVATRKGQQTQTDQIGIWLSGFFGSGKSHLAKIIGYLLANQTITFNETSQQPIDLFLDRVDHHSPRRQDIHGLLTQIRNFFQNSVLMFQIKSHENVLSDKNQRESITAILYSRYLVSIGLSKDLWTGRVELMIQRRGKYDDFCKAFERHEQEPWTKMRREFASVRANVERALHEVMPHTYHSPEEARRAIDDIRQSLRLTPEDLVQELSDYAAQQDSQAVQRSFKLVFIIDEMGQFIGDDGERLLELQTISEEFAKKGQGRLWLIVTAQEALDEIIKGVKQRKADYARIIDRFSLKIGLTSEQIEQVIEERILKKRPTAHAPLSSLFNNHQGLLCDISNPQSNRAFDPISAEQFEQSYPFLPYQFILMQTVFASLRARGGSIAQLSGAERSMLGVVQGVLNAPEASFANDHPGRLATLDEIYDQVLREVKNDDRRTIGDASKVQCPAFSPQKTLKAVFLLSQVDWFPRTIENIARVLTANTTTNFQTFTQEVAQALDALEKARYIVQQAGAYRYLSVAERGIEEEIESEQIKHQDIRRTARDILKTLLEGLGRVNYQQGLANFDVRVFGDDEELKTKGELKLNVYSPIACSYDDDLSVGNIRDVESPGDTRTIYWLPAQITDPKGHIERLLCIETVTKRRGDKDGGEEERAILREKETEASSLRYSLGQTFSRALCNGVIIYDGNETQLDAKTTTQLTTIFNRELSQIIPQVYTQFSTGGVPVKEEMIAKMLTEKATSLQSVVPTLHLWDAQGHINTHAPIVQAVLAELKKRGIATDGKTLLEYFQQIPYGWQPVVIRVVLAALFRAGTITLMQGQREFADPSERASHDLLIRATTFNKVLFDYDPLSGLSLTERNEAQRHITILFNRQVDDTTNTLAETLRKELQTLHSQNKLLLVQVQSISLPVPDLLFQGETIFKGILGKTKPDGLVKAFLDHTSDIESLQKIQTQIDDFFATGKDNTYRHIQRLISEITRVQMDVETLNTDMVKNAIADIHALQANRTIVESTNQTTSLYQTIIIAYQNAYTSLQDQRTAAYQQAAQEIAQWGDVPDEITSRIVEQPEPWNDQRFCYGTQSTTLYDVLTDIQLADGRKKEIIDQLYSEKEYKQKGSDGTMIREIDRTKPLLVRTEEYLRGEFTDEANFEEKLTAFAEVVRDGLQHGQKVVVQ